MDNLKFYEQGRSVPKEAQRVIKAGRLQGFTDINPMWRIKMLTEMFGAVGIGWWYTIDNQWLETAPNGEIKAFCNITLYYRDPETGEKSEGIAGHGGSSFVSKERKQDYRTKEWSVVDYVNDECYKMALTDAISIAAKALGIGADVYFAEDRTKYSKIDKNVSDTSKDDAVVKGVSEVAKIIEELKSNGVDKSAIANVIKEHYKVNGKPSANYKNIKDVDLLREIYQKLTELKGEGI